MNTDESKPPRPLDHVTFGYSLEVQPLIVTFGSILHLHRGHPQQRFVHTLFILAEIRNVKLSPQSTAMTASGE